MLVKSIIILALSALSVATPVQRQGRSCTSKPSTGSASAGSTAVPTLPLTGGVTELASPPANVTLAKIGLGHGIQNYTCTRSSANATLSAKLVGALAVLYDVTDLYPGSARGLSTESFQALSTNILWETNLPLNIDQSSATNESFPATSNPFPAPAPATLAGLSPIPFLGHHYFNAASTPTFDLSSTSGLLGSVKVEASIPAPTGANPGPDGTGAVNWLQLGDNGQSKGVAYVYRVTTAGGNALPCTTEGATSSVPYGALYWFYAPA